MTLSNCIGLLLKWTPEIIYLQRSAVNSPITVHCDSVFDPPSHIPPPPTSKYFFFLLKFNVITFH